MSYDVVASPYAVIGVVNGTLYKQPHVCPRSAKREARDKAIEYPGSRFHVVKHRVVITYQTDGKARRYTPTNIHAKAGRDNKSFYQYTIDVKAFLRSSPGARIDDIAKAIEQSNSQTWRVVNYLLERREVTREGKRPHRHYLSGDGT